MVCFHETYLNITPVQAAILCTFQNRTVKTHHAIVRERRAKIMLLNVRY
jgi:hypothetical protein